MGCIDKIKAELQACGRPEKVEHLTRFFQAFKGGYGEGDKFLAVDIPSQRKIARKYYKEISLREIESLLKADIHEYRTAALMMLEYKLKKADEAGSERIVGLYLRNIKHINNWDLIDSSAPNILGGYLYDKDRQLIYDFAASGDLWKQRIAIMTTYFFIKQKDFKDALKICRMYLNHKHDLIHKASGWMLREIGNRDFDAEYGFLRSYYKKMPRTMLRYAIEKFPEDLRQRFLKGEE